MPQRLSGRISSMNRPRTKPCRHQRRSTAIPAPAFAFFPLPENPPLQGFSFDAVNFSPHHDRKYTVHTQPGDAVAGICLGMSYENVGSSKVLEANTSTLCRLVHQRLPMTMRKNRRV
jgi:hypothetical protein